MRNCWAILAIAFVATACTEKLDSGRACPALCPIETVGIADTTISGVVFDSTIYAGPAIGSEPRILLAERTDSLVDLRGVIRFDSLPDTFTPTGASAGDTIRAVSHVALRVAGDSTIPVELFPKDSFTISAYDVDTTGVPDTAVAPVAALFTPSRLLGRVKFRREAVTDTMLIPLSDSIMNARFVAHGRLRIGLQVTSDSNATIRLSSNTGPRTPLLRYRASATSDTAQADTAHRSWYPYSKTPVGDPSTQANLADYTLVVKGTPAPPAGVIAVGGVPGRRAYLTFDVPRRLLDSTQIVRATLRLQQVAVPVTLPNDTARLEVLLGTAHATVADIAKRVLIHEPVTTDLNGFYYGVIAGLRELRLRTDTNATRSVEIAPILRNWAHVSSDTLPHAVVLQLPTEGTELTEIWFAGLSAPVAQRPSLQLTYVPRNAPGIP